MNKCLVASCLLLSATAGAAELPRVWSSYSRVAGADRDFADLKAHGVEVVGLGTGTTDDCAKNLAAVRRHGLKVFSNFAEVTESYTTVRAAGETPAYALMVGGLHQGLAIDRHLYSFAAKRHVIEVDSPVYSTSFDKDRQPVYKFMPNADPVKAEVVVPLKPFDGRQHLKVVPAAIVDRGGAYPKRVTLAFDLTGLDGAMLDKVGLAVYWTYSAPPPGTDHDVVRDGELSPAAPSTRAALVKDVQGRIGRWTAANGGTFPPEVIAFRFGDETFNQTSFVFQPSDSYPLWDYSEWGVAAFRRLVGEGVEPPRTWGHPEVYGRDAYACWLYAYHKACADLAKIAVDEAHRLVPGILVFRNQTRGRVWSFANDHDGTGQELLSKTFDFVHLDPYPRCYGGYTDGIPVDMGYLSGFARRYRKPLLPWTQAHRFGGSQGLCDPAPEDIDRMIGQHLNWGIDGIMWLGYGKGKAGGGVLGYTFPEGRPDSWEHASGVHRKLKESLPPKRKARLAVLRPYASWALSHADKRGICNPADWKLTEFLWAWSVQLNRLYDAFEIPPRESAAEKTAREKALKAYDLVISAEACPGATAIGADIAGDVLDAKAVKAARERLRAEAVRLSEGLPPEN